MTNKYSVNRYKISAIIGLFCIFSLSLTVKSSYSYGAVIITLTSIVFLVRTSSFKISSAQKQVLWAFLTYSLLLIALNILKKEEGDAFEYPIRILLLLPSIFLFKSLRIKPSLFFLLISIGLLLGSSFVLWDTIFNHKVRASNHLNPIFYGEICLLFSFLLIQGVLYRQSTNHGRIYLTVIYLLGAFVGLISMFTSGSRGSWVAIPFLLLLLFMNKSNKKSLFLIMSILFSIIISSYFIPQTGVKTRINLAKSDIIKFYQNDNKNTSIGLRLGLWEESHLFITQKPILGWNQSELATEKEKLIETNQISPSLMHIGHFHNQYIESLVKYGLVGFISFISILIIPLIVFIRQLFSKSKNLQHRCVAISGIATVGSFMLFSLTDILIQFNIGITIYTTLILYLISLDTEKTTLENAYA